MSTLRNHITNPGAEVTTAGWWVNDAIPGSLVQDPTFTARMMGARGSMQFRWTSAGDAVKKGKALAMVPPGQTPVTPGQWVRSGVRVWMDGDITARAGVSFYDENGTALHWGWGRSENHGWYDGGEVSSLTQAPKGASYVKARVELIASADWAAGSQKRVWLDNMYLYVGDTVEDVPDYYIDGTMTSTGEFAYGWDGKPHESTSYRIDTIDLVHPWTRGWWDTLPNAYKEADKHQNPELGGYPLLRWMNGIGQMAGEMRQISDDLWGGKYTDPKTAPESALRWLAMMLGLSQQHRQQPVEVLRERLVALTSVGRSASGTRAMVAESAKAYMLPGAQIRVEPSSTRPHYLIMYVRAYEVPNDDVEALAAAVQAAGFVPAGHIIEAQRVVTTWDTWEATAGKTWTEKEAKIKTWNESDSAGVILE